jgi:hypothetical protein
MGKAYKVTCPRCAHIFHFNRPELVQEADTPIQEQEKSLEQGSESVQSVVAGTSESSEQKETPVVPHLPTEQVGDDPLPPGAQIPQFTQQDTEKKEEVPSASQKVENLWEHWQKKRKSAESSARDEKISEISQSDGRPDGAPWESPEFYGFWGSFSQTLLGVIFRAPEFFRHVRCSFSIIRPILFYILLSLFQMLASRLWSMKALRELTMTSTDPQTLAMAENLMRSMNMPLMLLITPFFSIFQVVLLAGLYHLMIRMVQPDKADFATTLRVVCYSSAPLVLCIVPMVGSLLASVWFVAATFIGCKYALDLPWIRTVLALLPLYILELAFVSQIPALVAGALPL